jgi:hypothetical protein
MLKKFAFLPDFPGFVFDANGGGAGAGDGDGGNKPEPKFTQEDVDRMTGDARKQARKAATDQLLEVFEVKSVDDLKALLADAKKLKDGQQTEQEKLDKRAMDAEKALADLQKTSDQALADLRTKLLNQEIKILAAAQVVDKDKKVVRTAFKPEALEDVLVLLKRDSIEEKEGKYVGIDKALEELAKSKPYLLAEEARQSAYGSPDPNKSKPPKRPGGENGQETQGRRLISGL